MTKYKILRWDPIILGNNINPYPAVYIKPDKEFLEFAEQNNFSLVVKVDGTDTAYDGRAMVGILYNSSNFPNPRPNFFKATGLYMIVLYGPWMEYPPKNLGYVTITGLKGKYKVPPITVPEYKAPEPLQEMYGGKKCALSYSQIGIVLVALLVVFGVLLWLSMSKISKKRKRK